MNKRKEILSANEFCSVNRKRGKVFDSLDLFKRSLSTLTNGELPAFEFYLKQNFFVSYEIGQDASGHYDLASAAYVTTLSETAQKERRRNFEWFLLNMNELGLSVNSFHLGINVFDRFVRRELVEVHDYKLIAAVSIFLAGKYDSSDALLLLLAKKCSFTPSQILMMERHVLTTLNFGLTVPTVYSCLLQVSAALSIPSYLTSKAEIFLNDVVLTCCGMEKNTTRIATSVLLFCVKSFLERSVDSVDCSLQAIQNQLCTLSERVLQQEIHSQLLAMRAFGFNDVGMSRTLLTVKRDLDEPDCYSLSPPMKRSKLGHADFHKRAPRQETNAANNFRRKTLCVTASVLSFETNPTRVSPSVFSLSTKSSPKQQLEECVYANPKEINHRQSMMPERNAYEALKVSIATQNQQDGDFEPDVQESFWVVKADVLESESTSSSPIKKRKPIPLSFPPNKRDSKKLQTLLFLLKLLVVSACFLYAEPAFTSNPAYSPKIRGIPEPSHVVCVCVYEFYRKVLENHFSPL